MHMIEIVSWRILILIPIVLLTGPSVHGQSRSFLKLSSPIKQRSVSYVNNVRLFQDHRSYDLLVETKSIRLRSMMYTHIMHIKVSGNKGKPDFAIKSLGESTESHIGPVLCLPLIKPGKYQIVTELLGVSANEYRVLDISEKGLIREAFRGSMKSPPSFVGLNLDGSSEILEVVDTKKLGTNNLPLRVRSSRWVYKVWQYNVKEHRYAFSGFLVTPVLYNDLQ